MPTGTPIFSPACLLPAAELDRSGPNSLTPSDEERVFLIRSHSLLLGGPSAVRVGLGGLTPSDPSSGLGGLTLSPDDFRDFRQHGPRMRVDDLDVPSGELVARAHYMSLREVPTGFFL